MKSVDEYEKRPKNSEKEGKQDDEVFLTEEVEIEEMAIDGICGVY